MNRTMPDCVTVARQTLTLFVWVQILVGQPLKNRLTKTKLGGFCFVLECA